MNILVLLFILILTIVLVMSVLNNNKEKYQNYVVNDIKSVLYNTNGLLNFYSSGDNGSIYFENKENFNDFVSYVMYFLPSFIDDYCKAFENQNNDKARCNNLFIDNVSSPDVMFPSISQNEMTCNSVLSVTEANGKTNTVRVLNNLYYFLKRCLRFRTLKVNPIMLAIGPRNSTIQAYKITVSGDISAFILSRPLFISFGTYGLYRIIHNAKDSVFTNYVSDKAEYTFTVAPVYSYESASMFPFVTQNIGQLEINSKMPITIYYLTYNGPLLFSEVKPGVHKKSDICNVLTLVFSSEFLNNNKSEKTVSFTIPTTTGKIPNGIITATNIAIVYDKLSSVANDILSVTVGYGSVFTTIPALVPPEFVNEIANCRQKNIDHSFHFILTYSTDVIILTGFLTFNDSLKPDRIFMTRTPVNSGNQYVSIVYDNNIIDANLVKEMSKYNEFTSTNSIPNYAYVAKYLGYTI